MIVLRQYYRGDKLIDKMRLDSHLSTFIKAELKFFFVVVFIVVVVTIGATTRGTMVHNDSSPIEKSFFFAPRFFLRPHLFPFDVDSDATNNYCGMFTRVLFSRRN